MNYIRLDILDLALPALLLVLNGALSVALRLGLERQLAAAALRMVVQLMLVGYVLAALFALASPVWTAAAALAMVAFAGREIAARQARPLARGRGLALGTGCALAAAGSVTALALLTQLRPEPWYDPRARTARAQGGATWNGFNRETQRERGEFGRRAPLV